MKPTNKTATNISLQAVMNSNFNTKIKMTVHNTNIFIPSSREYKLHMIQRRTTENCELVQAPYRSLYKLFLFYRTKRAHFLYKPLKKRPARKLIRSVLLLC